MRKNKFGFTLGEVLVSLAVVGIIMALAAHTIKLAKSSYTAVTYHAFNNVNMIVGELKTGERIALNKSKERLPLALMQCRTSMSGGTTTILAPDYRSYAAPLCFEAGNPSANGGSGTADMLFCQNTIYFANTKGTTRCEYKDHLDVEFDSSMNEPKIKKESMTAKWATPNFVAMNGYRYYFSKWYYMPEVSDTYGFRIVAVDVNGTNGPNTTEYDAKTEILPDIVQFLVLDNGEVYPIGPAGSNLKVKDKIVTYLNTRIKGYNYRHDDTRTENVSSSCLQRNADGSMSRTCNFAVLYLQLSASESFFSYKEALCGAYEGTESLTYTEYCKDSSGNIKYPKSELCPPSSHEKRVDECNVKIIKPVFRYNFK